MIYKRAVARLRAQDWAAIAIELVIVVVGVFIGVQAANWNDERADRARAVSYLERVRDDLATDVATYSDRIRMWSEVRQFGDAALDFADSGATGERSQWQMLLAFFQASQIGEFRPTSATWDELKSAGELSLIRDVDLRNALSAYYVNADNRALSERPAYREHVRGLIPIRIQDYIWSHCFRSGQDYRQQLVDCRSPVSESQAGVVNRAIAGNQAVMAELRYWMSLQRVATIIATQQQAVARQLIERIDRRR